MLFLEISLWICTMQIDAKFTKVNQINIQKSLKSLLSNGLRWHKSDVTIFGIIYSDVI